MHASICALLLKGKACLVILEHLLFIEKNKDICEDMEFFFIDMIAILAYASEFICFFINDFCVLCIFCLFLINFVIFACSRASLSLFACCSGSFLIYLGISEKDIRCYTRDGETL